MEYRELEDFLYRPTRNEKTDWVFVGGLAAVAFVVCAITIFYIWL